MVPVFADGGGDRETVYRFGTFCVDTANACLRRSGVPVPLAPKVFDVLVVLCAHAGRLMSKADLIDTAWPGRVVSEGVLKTTISTLRQALSDDPQCPRYIETVHRRGYRFIAPVDIDRESFVAQPNPLTGVAPGPAVLPVAQLLGGLTMGGALRVTIEELRWRDDATLDGVTLRLQTDRDGR